jgi:transcriptional regulator with XRE-family HTH domain
MKKRTWQERVTREKARRGCSDTALAALLGVTTGTVYNWRTGRTLRGDGRQSPSQVFRDRMAVLESEPIGE